MSSKRFDSDIITANCTGSGSSIGSLRCTLVVPEPKLKRGISVKDSLRSAPGNLKVISCRLPVDFRRFSAGASGKVGKAVITEGDHTDPKICDIHCNVWSAARIPLWLAAPVAHWQPWAVTGCRCFTNHNYQMAGRLLRHPRGDQ